MDTEQLAIADFQSKAQKRFAAGMKAFDTGFPQPPVNTPECWGWEAAEKIREIKQKYCKDMLQELEASISA